MGIKFMAAQRGIEVRSDKGVASPSLFLGTTCSQSAFSPNTISQKVTILHRRTKRAQAVIRNRDNKVENFGKPTRWVRLSL